MTAVAAVLLALTVPAAFSKSAEKRMIREALAQKLVLPENFTVTVEPSTRGPATFLDTKAALNGSGDIVALDVAFYSGDEPVLARSYSKAGPDSVKLERVFAEMKARPGKRLMLRLREVSNLGGINELVEKYSLQGRVFCCVMSVSQAAFVSKRCPLIPMYVDAGKQKLQNTQDCIAFIEEIMPYGPAGVTCAVSSITSQLVEAAQGYGLKISATQADSQADMYKALLLKVDDIATPQPDTLLALIHDWTGLYAQ
ncbi:MAG: hypothetical protein BWY37_01069 [Firmicutes bacterium ADurb.Bin262]|nr:MAG: hypothetical protein BWY37_01069 [Firmicutes bacterium ADurb.Bin262]